MRSYVLWMGNALMGGPCCALEDPENSIVSISLNGLFCCIPTRLFCHLHLPFALGDYEKGGIG